MVNRCGLCSGKCYVKARKVFERKFFLDQLDGLAGFNRSGTGDAANQPDMCTFAVAQVWVGLSECFGFH